MSGLNELLPELVELVGFAVGSVLLTALGVLAEQAGLQELGLGHQTLGLWLLFVGALLLYAGFYQMGVKEFLRRVIERGSGT